MYKRHCNIYRREENLLPRRSQRSWNQISSTEADKTTQQSVEEHIEQEWRDKKPNLKHARQTCPLLLASCFVEGCLCLAVCVGWGHCVGWTALCRLCSRLVSFSFHDLNNESCTLHLCWHAWWNYLRGESRWDKKKTKLHRGQFFKMAKQLKLTVDLSALTVVFNYERSYLLSPNGNGD